MNYKKVFELLSELFIGAMLIRDNTVLEINTAGSVLSGINAGDSWDDIPHPIAKLLGDGDDYSSYVNTAYCKYVVAVRCDESFFSDLPTGARVALFRNASADAIADVACQTLDNIRQPVVICDEANRIFYLNKAAERTDGLTQDVLGENVTDIYEMVDGSGFAILNALKTGKTNLDNHQIYVTSTGKKVEVITNTYPISKNGNVIAGVNIMEDTSTLDELTNKIISLQDMIIGENGGNKKSRKNPLRANYNFEDIICQNNKMEYIIGMATQVATTDASIMFYGETGTGKELFAGSVHNASKRRNKPFLAVNCAAIPGNLLEGILFGTEKGAYTGAESRKGLFEQADGGTLLLDELNSMHMDLQPKLLRVLQDGTFRRVGGEKEITVDVRVLSNINIPVEEALEKGLLRQDLYYRLGAILLTIPPLRDRTDDIPVLCNHFINKFANIMGKNAPRIADEAMDIMNSYGWPGNVRELEHAIEHAMILLPEDGIEITASLLPKQIKKPTILDQESLTPISRSRYNEKEQIEAALVESRGNITKAAEALGMSRQKLSYRMKILGVERN